MAGLVPAIHVFYSTVIPGRCKASNYDAQLRIRESRDSGSGPSDPPGMTGREAWMPGIADKLTQSAQDGLLWSGMTEQEAASAQPLSRQHLFQDLPLDALVGE